MSGGFEPRVKRRQRNRVLHIRAVAAFGIGHRPNLSRPRVGAADIAAVDDEPPAEAGADQQVEEARQRDAIAEMHFAECCRSGVIVGMERPGKHLAEERAEVDPVPRVIFLWSVR